ncbi:MAG: SUMF1/EgtB/PvdO family nonheme iron enzyme [Planctomycetes bacterium]|nr:SUMF1/EgtB/PvdO family nonheme iron enzyme [Planctomycetota bacterium]
MEPAPTPIAAPRPDNDPPAEPVVAIVTAPVVPATPIEVPVVPAPVVTAPVVDHRDAVRLPEVPQTPVLDPRPVAAPGPAPDVGPKAPPGLGAVASDAHGFFADLTVAGQTQRFRYVAPGTFTMGSPDGEAGHDSDETAHQVTLTRGFWIADSECTQRLWQAVLDEKPSTFLGEQLPVHKVSRDDCERFCARLNQLVPGIGARLPWEAEWEYACRAGTSDPYPGFWKLDDTRACYGSRQPRPVKSYPCNAWGLYDVVGNVREWCRDSYADFAARPATDPHPAGKGKGVSRGGCWEDSAKSCRSASRDQAWLEVSAPSIGLRLVLDAVPAH